MEKKTGPIKNITKSTSTKPNLSKVSITPPMEWGSIRYKSLDPSKGGIGIKLNRANSIFINVISIAMAKNP